MEPSPSESAFSRSMTITAAAPSLVCDALPAVTDPVTEKAGRNLLRISIVVPSRTPSSVVN